MELTRINVKLSKSQHDMLKELSQHYGFNMTSWIQHTIVNEYNKLNQIKMLPKGMDTIKSVLDNIESLKLLNQSKGNGLNQG